MSVISLDYADSVAFLVLKIKGGLFVQRLLRAGVLKARTGLIFYRVLAADWGQYFFTIFCSMSGLTGLEM